MRVSIDLLGLPGAELVTQDGIEGVFIPRINSFSSSSSVPHTGAQSRIISISLLPVRKRNKTYEYDGVLMVPRLRVEELLANSNFVPKRKIAWLHLTNRDNEERILDNASLDLDTILNM